VTRLSDLLGTLPRRVEGTPYAVVFVCTGNICRSPMAEIATRAMAETTVLADGSSLADRLVVTSAGTGPWHEGEPMDPRAGAALRRAGYPDHSHVAHQVSVPHLQQTNLIVALDRRHQQTLRSLGTASSHLFLLRSFDPSAGAASDVPDPYYGDDAEFDACLQMIANGCRGLVSALASLWGDAPTASEL
jgi:protein-tyrosine phosphatase